VHQLTLSLCCNHWKIQNMGDSHDAINTIRRSANDKRRGKPMMSVFYDVICLESVHGHSNVLIEGHFWRFWRNLNRKMLSAIVWTPKRHFLTSQRVFWAIVRQNLSTNDFSRRVREKINKKTKNRKALYFTYFARNSLMVDWHNFLITCLSRGRNQLCKVLS